MPTLPTEWTVVIAAHNHPLRRRLADAFMLDGHDPHVVATVADAIATTDTVGPVAVVVAELEHPSGMARLLAQLRAEASSVRPPVLVGIARGPAESDRIRLLEAGADSVVPSESGYLELRASIAALLRLRMPQQRERIVSVGALRVDLRNRTVRYGAEFIDVTAKEYDLLRTLIEEPDRIFTKHELLQGVWGYKAQSVTRTLDSHACRLRRKLDRPGLPPLVQNVWGVGYRLLDSSAGVPAVAEAA